MTVSRKARMPPPRGRMKSMDVLTATATHSRTDRNGGKTPERLTDTYYRRPFMFKWDLNDLFLYRSFEKY